MRRIDQDCINSLAHNTWQSMHARSSTIDRAIRASCPSGPAAAIEATWITEPTGRGGGTRRPFRAFSLSLPWACSLFEPWAGLRDAVEAIPRVAPSKEECMRTAIISAALSVALSSVWSSARATDLDNYRSDEFRGNCRVVVTHTSNRWGDDVTVRTVVCG